MQKTEKYNRQKIAEEIKRVASLEQNKETAGMFWEFINAIKSDTCEVKYGWHAGKSVGFTLRFPLNSGEHNAFDLFINSLNDTDEIYGFLCGLNAENFSFDIKYCLKTNTDIYVSFKITK